MQTHFVTRRSVTWGAAVLATVLAAGLGLPAQAQKSGGALNIATIGEPPTLDPMASTADLVGIISQHIFETLYTFGDGWKLVPLLAAEMPAITDGGKTYTIKLRQGVTFHDGSAMTSADVVASLKRWGEVAVRGKQAAAQIDSITATDGSTVVIRMKEPFAPLLALLALNNSAAVIMPASKQPAQLTEFIGTGPYKFKERQPDRYVLLTKNDTYASRSGNADFFGGARKPYVDELRFVPVPNANTRVEAAIAGQYQFVDSLPVEAYPRLKGAKSDGVLIKPFGWPIMFFNTKQGSLANATVRRAVLASLSFSDMMEAAFGSKDYYEVDGSLYPKGFVFHSMAGTEAYNKPDPARAKKAAADAGYKGEPVRILTSMQYEFHYKMAAVASEYLKQAGFKVDMQVVDWATLTQRRNDPALWEIYFTHSPFLPEPALNNMMNNNAPGWWATPEKDKLVAAFNTESDSTKRVAILADIQKLMYTEVPLAKVGNFNAVSAKAKNLQGVVPSPWPFFWNTWLD